LPPSLESFLKRAHRCSLRREVTSHVRLNHRRDGLLID
jgi:hypothetical protein